MRPTIRWLAPTVILIGAPLLLIASMRPNSPVARGRVSSAYQAASVARKVLVFYDLEGASGTIAERREAIVRDVSTVVSGLFEGGATTVDVLNTHGVGDPTLVPAERLDPRARTLVRHDASTDTWLDTYSPDNGLATPGTYDAVVAVGMHGKPLSGGFQPHTIGAGLSPVINGATLSETELVGYAFGTAGISVALVSGDDRLKLDLAVVMPWVEYVVVKRATGPNSTDPLPAQQVQSELRAAAIRAVRSVSRMRPMRLSPPVRAGLLPTFPAALPPEMKYLPGLDVRGDTVTFIASDYPTAYRGIRALATLANANRRTLVLEFLRGRPELRALLGEAQDSIDARWTALEERRWKP